MRDTNPLPLGSEALDQSRRANIFSQVDVIGAYHQMRVREEGCNEIAVRTRFGSFQWCVL